MVAQHKADFGMAHFGLRFLFALLLVMLSYNPSGYSFSHWLMHNFPSITPILAISGIALIIGWAIYLRASFRSLGAIGMVLALALFGCLVWLLVDIGLLSINNVSAFSWVALVLLAVVLAFGISWSHIRRRISGQVDTDDLDD